MEYLIRSTLHALVFFELVEDHVLDPDTALKMSESIIGEIENCDEEEKIQIFKVCKQLVLEEKNGSNRSEVIEFLEEFNESYLPNY